MRQALLLIGTACENFLNSSCWANGRSPDAAYTADKWCAPCIAAYGLGVGPEL
jgi:hypothetical protein